MNRIDVEKYTNKSVLTNGSCLNAIDKNTALAIYPTPVIIDGISTVNPLDIFIVIAHVISRVPAINK
nr:hypothetical protein [Butyrivibrio sp. VCD2006]